MKCQRCGTSDTWVLSTRTVFSAVRRRRFECGNGHRFSTIETYSTIEHHLTKPLDTLARQFANGIAKRKEAFDFGREVERKLRVHPVAEVARMLGRHRNSIYHVIKRLGLKEKAQ